ncbi:hypothetical protein ACRASH_14010 [Staphylococcus aureus]
MDHQFQQTMQVGVGPNTEAGEKSAYKNVQVGGATTERNRDHQFQQTMQVGGGPNIEAGEKSAYKNVQVGGAPT